MEFKGFSKKTLPFLESIRQNNDKEWFESNRDTYEKHILNLIEIPMRNIY